MTKKTAHVYESKPLDATGRAHYSEEENSTWSFLLKRQKELIKNHASVEFIKGVEKLNFTQNIPQHYEISEQLKKYTGWSVEPVPALIQPEQFFNLLSNKKFPAANFIRIPEEIDYIKEPDVFHELFGHCPLLTLEPYAEFMHHYGKLAMKADHKTKVRMFRLFWFTIEFGLIKENDQFKAYGGGILSSKSEVIYSTDSEIPERLPLIAENAFLTPFRIDILQPVYYYINSYEELFKLIAKDPLKLAIESMEKNDFAPKFKKKTKTKEVAC